MARKGWQLHPAVQTGTLPERWPVDLWERVSYHRFMSLLRGLFWLVLFAFFTFCFVVLFEYGTHDFASGFQAEFEKVKTFAQESVKPSPKPKK
jgi:hypothetical protein